MKQQSFLLLLAFALCLLFACNSAVNNPYDEVEDPEIIVDNVPVLDSQSIQGLHKLIFEPKCAIPSCHGGTFEPDYRTPASTWNTMVWQPVVKNDAEYSFRHRVVPYDTSASWLHERLLTDDELLGRMPRYQAPLEDWEMQLINRWIMDGAKDLLGQPAVQPDENISFYGIGCYILGNNQNFADDRLGWAKPFNMPANTELLLPIYAWDEDTPNPQFQDVKLMFSTDPYFFTNAFEADNIVFNNDLWLWIASINSGNLTPGVQYYYRFSGRDGTHSNSMLFPNQSSFDYFFEHHSFIVQ